MLLFIIPFKADNLSMFPNNSAQSSIFWKGLHLPKWLFYFPKNRTNFIADSATFKVQAALEGNPWANISSPALTPKPKTLILTRAVFCNF